MIRKFTKNTPGIKEEIEEIVGKPFGFLNRLKIRSNTSPRFIIVSASDNIKKHLIKASNVNYSIIEMRPKGIIINFYSVLNYYVWVIPYTDLKITHTGDSYKISSKEDHIRFSPKLSTKSHDKFMTKLMSKMNSVSEENQN